MDNLLDKIGKFVNNWVASKGASLDDVDDNIYVDMVESCSGCNSQDEVNDMLDSEYEMVEVDTTDINGDGDKDVAAYDTDGDGKKDTAEVGADDKEEAKDAVKEATKEVKDDKDGTKVDSTGTATTNPYKVSDEKQKNKEACVSDMRMKNIMSTLLDCKY